MTLQELLVKISADVSEYTTGVDQVIAKTSAMDTAVGRSGGGLESLATSLSKVGSSLTSVGAGLTAAITLPLAGISIAALKVSSDLDVARIAFTTMLGSAAAAQKHLEDLRAFAEKTPFQFTELVESSKRLQAMGFSAKEIIPTLNAIGNAVANLGGGAEKLNAIALALGQMRNAGRVNAQDMNQLTSAGINGWQMLADAIGKAEGKLISIAKVREMSEKGMINGAAAATTILDALEAKYKGSLESQSKLLAGMWSNLQDKATAILGDIGKALTPAAMSLVQTFTDLLPAISGAVEWFKQLPVPIQTGAVAFVAMAAAAGPLLLVLGQLASATGAVLKGIGTIASLTAGGASIFGSLAGSAGAATTSLSGAAGALSAIGLAAIPIAAALAAITIGFTQLKGATAGLHVLDADFEKFLANAAKAAGGIDKINEARAKGLIDLGQYNKLLAIVEETEKKALTSTLGGFDLGLKIAGGKTGPSLIDQAAAEKAAKEAAKKALQQAFSTFGLHNVQLELKEMEDAYKLLEKSGKASTGQLEEAWGKLQDAIKAAGESTREFLRGSRDFDMGSLGDLNEVWSDFLGGAIDRQKIKLQREQDLKELNDFIDDVAEIEMRAEKEAKELARMFPLGGAATAQSFVENFTANQGTNLTDQQKKVTASVQEQLEQFRQNQINVPEKMFTLKGGGPGDPTGVTNPGKLTPAQQLAAAQAYADVLVDIETSFANMKQGGGLVNFEAFEGLQNFVETLPVFIDKTAKLNDALQTLGVSQQQNMKAFADAFKLVEEAYKRGEVSTLQYWKAQLSQAEAAAQATRETGVAMTAEQGKAIFELEERIRKVNRDVWREVHDEVRGVVDTLGRGFSDAVLNFKTFRDFFVDLKEMIKDIGKDIFTKVFDALTEGIKKKLTDSITDLLTGIGPKIATALAGGVAGLTPELAKFGMATQSAAVAAATSGQVASASTSVANAAGSTASSAAKVASSSVSAITGIVTGVVSAVSDVIGNFQFYAMNKSLDLIVNHTLRIFNSVEQHRLDAWDREGHLMAKLDDIWKTLSEGLGNIFQRLGEKNFGELESVLRETQAILGSINIAASSNDQMVVANAFTEGTANTLVELQKANTTLLDILTTMGGIATATTAAAAVSAASSSSSTSSTTSATVSQAVPSALVQATQAAIDRALAATDFEGLKRAFAGLPAEVTATLTALAESTGGDVKRGILGWLGGGIVGALSFGLFGGPDEAKLLAETKQTISANKLTLLAAAETAGTRSSSDSSASSYFGSSSQPDSNWQQSTSQAVLLLNQTCVEGFAGVIAQLQSMGGLGGGGEGTAAAVTNALKETPFTPQDPMVSTLNALNRAMAATDVEGFFAALSNLPAAAADLVNQIKSQVDLNAPGALEKLKESVNFASSHIVSAGSASASLTSSTAEAARNVVGFARATAELTSVEQLLVDQGYSLADAMRLAGSAYIARSGPLPSFTRDQAEPNGFIEALMAQGMTRSEAEAMFGAAKAPATLNTTGFSREGKESIFQTKPFVIDSSLQYADVTYHDRTKDGYSINISGNTFGNRADIDYMVDLIRNSL